MHALMHEIKYSLTVGVDWQLTIRIEYAVPRHFCATGATFSCLDLLGKYENIYGYLGYRSGKTNTLNPKDIYLEAYLCSINALRIFT